MFVVEDNALTRYVLRVYLSREPDIELTGECDGTGDVVSEVETSAPEVVLLDYRLPGAKGDVLARQLKTLRPELKVLSLSLDSEFGRSAMLAAGADAFLAKTSMEKTMATVRQLASGEGIRARLAIIGSCRAARLAYSVCQ